MPFTHSIIIEPSEDFKSFLRSIREIITNSGNVYDNWEDSYEKSPIVISKQSQGNGEKITEVHEVNKLYHGLLENYYMIKPTITFQELVVKNVNGQYQIWVRFNSPDVSNLKVDFAYDSGLEIDRYENTIIYRDEDGMVKSFESIYPDLCLLSTKHIKKKGEQEKLNELMNISNNITRFIRETYGLNLEFESEGFKYVPDAKKCKPIQLFD
jgi:hypothetical protein